MKSEENEIEKMAPGPVLNALVQAEIFGAIPLSDEEWEISRATFMMTQGPHSAAMQPRPVKIMRIEPQYETGLMFYLDYPRDYSRDQFNSSRELINKMRADGWMFELCDYVSIARVDGVARNDKIFRIARFRKESIEAEAIAETDAHAICKAALIAVRKLKAITK
jgi:hypothetical protein